MVAALSVALAMSVVTQAEPFKEPGAYKIVWAHSPHQDARPANTDIDMIVLHHTASSNLVGVVKWFENPTSRVSAHYTVGKDGSIVQHVSTFRRAWHAGVSKDDFGRENLNRNSVGIEMVNVGDGKDPWPDVQVEAVRRLVAHLVRHRFPGTKQVVSHEYIARPIGRKPDPKNFPWEKLEGLGVPLVYKMPPKNP